LQYARLNDISVWRISAGDEDTPVNRIASGKVLVYKVGFA
jgi:hypothetical protein